MANTGSRVFSDNSSEKEGSHFKRHKTYSDTSSSNSKSNSMEFSSPASHDDDENNSAGISSNTPPRTPKSTAISSFKALFQLTAVPKCSGHGEVCAVRTVIKTGSNEGRRYAFEVQAIG